jgi:O-antigen/teichoic acid export membrane protein
VSSFLRSSFLAVMGEVVMFVGALLYGMITARALGPSGKGILGVLLGAYQIVVTILSLRVERAVVYYSAAEPDAISRTVTAALVLGFSALIVFLPLYSFIPESVKHYFFGGVSPDFVAVGMLYMPSIFLSLTIQALLAGQRKFGSRLTFLSIVYGVRVVMAFTMLILMEVSLMEFIVLSAVTEFLLYGSLLVYLFVHNTWALHLKWNHLRSMIRYSMANFLGALAELIIISLPLFVLSVVRGSTEAGLFVVATMMSTTLAYLANAIKVVVLPYAAASSSSVDETRILRVLLLIETVMAVGLVAVGRYVLIFLYGSQFEGSFFPAVLLIPGVIGATYYGVLIASIQGRGRPGLASLAALLGGCCAVGVSLTFIPKFGIDGAAIASTVANLASALAAIAIYWHLTRSPVGRLFFVEVGEARGLVTSLRAKFHRSLAQNR